jgi:hypothetical protein
MTDIEWVRLAGHRVSIAAVRADPNSYTRVLAAARSEKTAQCLCQPPTLPLVVRCTHNGRYHLACWPNQGASHHPRCPFFRIEPQLSGRRTYSDAAIRETPGGTAIRLADPLAIAPKAAPRRSNTSPTDHTVSRRTVGFLGLLHHLWESAALTVCTGPRPRHWATAVAALNEQLSACTISGQPGPDVVYIVPPYRPEDRDTNIARFDTFLQRLRDKAGTVRRGLILGELKAVRTTKYGVSYQFSHQSPQRQIFASRTLNDKIHASYPCALGAAADHAGGRRIMLAYIERSPTGYAIAIDAAVMLTNNDYIPADSSHEVRMADALRTAGRTYIKPLTYDGRDAVLPDFILTDQPDTYVEVWGLPGRDNYERRKAKKIAYYQRRHHELIEWTVTDPIPVIPPAPSTGAG